MQRTHPGRSALIRRLVIAAALSSLLSVALATALGDSEASANASAKASANASAKTGAKTSAKASTTTGAVTVRVEGSKATLLPARKVALSANKVVKNGVAADSCAGRSAAGALEVATHGDWNGSWSAAYRSYFLTSIDGLTLPGSGAEFWAFWVNDAPASEGICSYHPKPGDSLLFFPDCYGKSCPKSAGVLGVKAPAVAVLGSPFVVAVTAYSDAKGTPSKAVGVTVSAAGQQVKTGPAGTATLVFAHAGALTLKVAAPDAIRTETSVCVQAAAAKTCA